MSSYRTGQSSDHCCYHFDFEVVDDVKVAGLTSHFNFEVVELELGQCLHHECKHFDCQFACPYDKEKGHVRAPSTQFGLDMATHQDKSLR